MKNVFLSILLISVLLIGLTGCDPSFTDYICKEGQIWLVPPDNHSGSEWMGKGDVICFEKSRGTAYSVCPYFNNAGSCHYKDCPDCVVMYCGENNEKIASDISCYDYYMDREDKNILLPFLNQ